MQASQPIPLVDFGGVGPTIHFAHANAYPPGCYRQFLEALTGSYHVWAVEQRPLWPQQSPEQLDSWNLFARDLIRALEQQGEKRVIGAGHSLGAVTSMLAALERPDLFAALIVIEPVLLPPAILEAVRAYPQQATKTPMVRRARKRRDHWDNRQQAFDHFRGKAVFQRLSDDVLWDYVNHGLVDTANGEVKLRFPRAWEAQIYGHPPTSVWEIVPQITVPTLAIRGVHSDALMPEAWQLWQTLQPAAHFVELVDCGHLVPLERPAQVANLTRAFLEKIIL